MTEPNTQKIIPPPRNSRELRPSDGLHVAEANHEPVVLSEELPPDLEFDPVPHAPHTGVKFTPELQRMFVGALAACGSVTISAAAVNISTGQVYYLRQKAGAESFAAAWDKAVERGALRVRDVLVDQAINGIPEYVYGPDGKLLIERRRFNTRMMMWIVAHHLPEKYGVTGGLMHNAGGPIGLKRLKAQWIEEGRAQAQPEIASEEELRRKVKETFDRLAEHKAWMERHEAAEPKSDWSEANEA